MDRKKPEESKASDMAPSGRREDFIENFFRKGAEFASELIVELQELRDNARRLEAENLELKHQLASDDAIRELLDKIEKLEAEKNSLRSSAQNAEEASQDYAGRYEELERELDAMANLYVASYQLHATLVPQEVLGTIEQLLAQLVGASSFAIFIRRDEGGDKSLEPVHAYHCSKVAGSRVAWGEGPVGEAAANQVHFVADPKAHDGQTPLACVPMVLGEETIGVIVIYGLFEQKDEFVEIDFELFKLLALHSASAIVGAGLMDRAGGVKSSLESYRAL